MKDLIKTLAISALAAAFCCARAQASATNDLFANRTLLVGTNVVVQGDNTGAGTEAGEITDVFVARRTCSVWYSWVAPTNGVFRWGGYPLNDNFSMSINVYSDPGGTIANLTPKSSAPGGGVIVAPGDVLAIQVSALASGANPDGPTGPFVLGVSFEAPQPTSYNDNYTNGIAISTPSYHFAGNVNGASLEAGEILPDGAVTQTLWWKFNPTNEGLLETGFSSPGFSTWLTVFQGTNVGTMAPLTPVANNLYRVYPGNEYSIQLGAAPLTMLQGAFDFAAIFTAQTNRNNDSFTNAEPLQGTNVTYLGTYSNATSEPGEPNGGASNTIWVKWTSPFTSRGQIRIFGNEQYCAVYTGSSVDLLTSVPIAGSAFLATEGTTYYFQFSGSGESIRFNLTLFPLAGAPFDNFANAQAGNKGESSVMGATMEAGEPEHLGPVDQKSVWWKWQASVFGITTITNGGSLAQNPVIAIYTGDSVDSLTLVVKGTNSVQFTAAGGETYYIAGAVPTNATGDIVLNSSQIKDSSEHIVAGNLLQQPSWEGTFLGDTTYWHWTGSLGGNVNSSGGLDGSTWPSVSSGKKLWQTVPTIPGNTYRIRFAWQVGAGAGTMEVSWDTNVVGTPTIPGDGAWHWNDLTFVATNSFTTVSFHNLGSMTAMDAFSVVDQSLPPTIITEPASSSTIEGGSSAFLVGVAGSNPLKFQWFFNGNILSNQTSRVLSLNSVTTNDAGDYFVIVTNNYGAVTSAVATLQVDVSPYPRIVWQPYGGTQPAGTYFAFSVAVIGAQPLSYQWFKGATLLSNETNQTLVFNNISASDAASYAVRVQNSAGTVFSLPATLTVGGTNAQGGGLINFANFISLGSSSNAPIYDVDGVTKLRSNIFVAQLYAGPSLATIRPVSFPRPFQTVSLLAGYFTPQTVVLPDVPGGSNAIAQVRVWEAAKGSTYEEARARGGKFGKSSILTVQTVPPPTVPPLLTGLQSFSLQAGLPYLTTAVIQFVDQLPDGSMVWSMTGATNYRYLIEQSSGDNVWQPFIVITNLTGTVNFTNTPSGGGSTFFRSRILD